jgi:lycopene cyclase domain-containing protein
VLGHGTYLVFELAWGLPVLAVQWAVGWRRLRARWRPLVVALLLTTVYLVTADGVAIHAGIWTIHPSRTTDISLFAVPIEEMVFFLVTNAMVVQTVLLLWPRTWSRTG